MRILLHLGALAGGIGGINLFMRARKTIVVYLRARALTKLVECEAETGVARLGHYRARGGWMDDDDDLEAPEYKVLRSGEIAAQDRDGTPITLAPDAPSMSELSHAVLTRRARLFMQYWCARVHEKYNVVGNWDKSALACTKIWLCKVMKEPREYYVSVAQENGGVVRERRCKKGMHTSQISACVDWIVTAAHKGTVAQAAQNRIRHDSRPNLLMRIFGISDCAGGW